MGVEDTDAASAVPAGASVFVQAIGASQDHTIKAAATVADAEGVDLRELRVPRRVRATEAAFATSGRDAQSGLPDIVDDVAAVKRWLSGQPGVEVNRTHVAFL